MFSMSPHDATSEKSPPARVGLAGTRGKQQRASLIGAARDLAAASGDASFTVDQVVERSGLSLKTFYRHFAGKDGLLLALVEDDCHRGSAILLARMDGSDDAIERLRRFVAGFFAMVTVGSGYASLLVREHLHLQERHPIELQRALAPLLELLTAELSDGMRAGVVRAGDAHRDAVVVFNLVLAHIHAVVLGQLDDDMDAAAEHLWGFCRAALEPRRSSKRTQSGRKRRQDP